MVLVDAGPLIALIHAEDNQHERCKAAFLALDESMGTVWPHEKLSRYIAFPA